MTHLRISDVWHIAFLDYLLIEHPETQTELETLLQEKESLDCLLIKVPRTVYDPYLGWITSKTVDKTNYPTALKMGREIQFKRYKEGKEKELACPFAG